MVKFIEQEVCQNENTPSVDENTNEPLFITVKNHTKCFFLLGLYYFTFLHVLFNTGECVYFA
jgi:hypothetical protein